MYNFNHLWAKVILSSLIRYGAKHFCIAPGSRCTPLVFSALELQKQHNITLHNHFDERGLGFLALGIAKKTQEPVVLIVTSGSAVANLYPAIVEAYLTQQKLIILSSDRPTELFGFGANQVIQQQGIFASFTVDTLNLPNPKQCYASSWLVQALEKSLLTQQEQKGPLQINVPFIEPLYEETCSQEDYLKWLKPIKNWFEDINYKWLARQELASTMHTEDHWVNWRNKKGVVLVGDLGEINNNAIRFWANKLGWCLITDVQANCYSDFIHAEFYLANKQICDLLLQADIVVQFGGRFVGKHINKFLENFNGELWQVNSQGENHNQYFKPQKQFFCTVESFLKAHQAVDNQPWFGNLQNITNHLNANIKEKLGSALHEASLAFNIQDILPSRGVLFLGNSMFIRLVDSLGNLPEGYSVYANRGVSGIDGLVATISGIASVGNEPLVAFVGDLSALYDLNSFALLAKIEVPTVVFVINNSGGSIFDLFPIEPEIKRQFYRMEHNLSFSYICTMFNLSYFKPYTWADLRQNLRDAFNRKRVTIIEISSTPGKATGIYKDLLSQVSEMDLISKL